MTILHLFVVLIVVGVLLWLVNQYIPISPPIKRIINIVAVLLVVLWLLSLLGGIGSFGSMRIGTLRC